jgi:predicted nucleotidyltransferase
LDVNFLAKLAAELSTAGIEAIVVGNVASILNDAPVLTRDVDLFVRDTAQNRKKLRRLAEALGGIGPQPISDLTKAERIYGTAVPIDVLYDRIAGPLSFASVRSRARTHIVGSEILMVASLADVIKSKTAAGRAKDKAVLPILRDTLATRRARGLE